MRYCDIVTVNVTHEVGGGGCIGWTKPPGLGGNDNGGITNPVPLLGKGGGNGGVINPVTLLGRRGGNGGIAYPVPAWPPRGPIADTGPLLTLAKSNVGTSVLDSTFPFPASTTTEWIWFPNRQHAQYIPKILFQVGELMTSLLSFFQQRLKQQLLPRSYPFLFAI